MIFDGQFSRAVFGWITAASLLVSTSFAQNATQSAGQVSKGDQSSDYRIRVTSDLVLVNAVVRDKKGNLVLGLKQSEFTILEDGKPQRIASFDFENVEELTRAGAEQPTVSGTANSVKVTGTAPVAKEDIQNRRLIVLFFDFTGMETEDIDHSVEAAQKFVDKQMTP